MSILGPNKTKRYTGAHQSLAFSRRMLLVGGAQAAVGALLVGRLGYLAVAQNEHYKLLSESNRVQLIVVPPRRGGTGMSWTRLLSLSSLYFSFWVTAR